MPLGSWHACLGPIWCMCLPYNPCVVRIIRIVSRLCLGRAALVGSQVTFMFTGGTEDSACAIRSKMKRIVSGSFAGATVILPLGRISLLSHCPSSVQGSTGISKLPTQIPKLVRKHNYPVSTKTIDFRDREEQGTSSWVALMTPVQKL